MACDGNEIDTMFVDRRRDGGQTGQTLVNVCSDVVSLCLGLVSGSNKTCVTSATLRVIIERF